MQFEIREVKESEKTAVKAMVNKAFAKEEDTEIKDTAFFLQLNYLDLPGPDYFRAVFVDQRPGSSLMAVPFIVRMGCVPFKCAGYTGMATDLEFRGKGFASKLLVEYEKFLRNKGYDAIVLHSSADLLYKKHGFEMIFGNGQFEFETESIKQFPLEYHEDLKIQIVKKLDELENLSEITLEIYHEHIANRIDGFHVVRTRRFWQQNLLYLLSNKHSVVLLYQKDKPIAYGIYSLDKNEDIIKGIKFSELFSQSNDPNILIILLKKLIEKYDDIHEISGEYQFFRTELKEMTEKFGGKMIGSFASKNMFHIIDISVFLKKMEPEFIRRLEKTNTSFNFDFIIKIPDAKISLRFQIENNIVNILDSPLKSSLATISIENELFYGLIFGTYPPLEILEDCDLEHTEFDAIKELFANLFPFCGPVWSSTFHY